MVGIATPLTGELGIELPILCAGKGDVTFAELGLPYPMQAAWASWRRALVYKSVDRLGRHWRGLNGGATVMTLGLAGERFVDGVLVRRVARKEERAA